MVPNGLHLSPNYSHKICQIRKQFHHQFTNQHTNLTNGFYFSNNFKWSSLQTLEYLGKPRVFETKSS